jgi:hypothetical protein
VASSFGDGSFGDGCSVTVRSVTVRWWFGGCESVGCDAPGCGVEPGPADALSEPRSGGCAQGKRSLASRPISRLHGGMTNHTTPPPASAPHRSDDDELVIPEPHTAVPDHLDRRLEVPEADAIEQELDVPIDDEER